MLFFVTCVANSNEIYVLVALSVREVSVISVLGIICQVIYMMHKLCFAVFSVSLTEKAFVVLLVLDLFREPTPVFLLIELALAAVPDKLSKLFCCNHSFITQKHARQACLCCIFFRSISFHTPEKSGSLAK